MRVTGGSLTWERVRRGRGNARAPERQDVGRRGELWREAECGIAPANETSLRTGATSQHWGDPHIRAEKETPRGPAHVDGKNEMAVDSRLSPGSGEEA